MPVVSADRVLVRSCSVLAAQVRVSYRVRIHCLFWGCHDVRRDKGCSCRERRRVAEVSATSIATCGNPDLQVSGPRAVVLKQSELRDCKQAMKEAYQLRRGCRRILLYPPRYSLLWR